MARPPETKIASPWPHVLQPNRDATPLKRWELYRRVLRLSSRGARTLPDHRRVIPVDRADDIRIPAVEAAHRQRPERTQVNHFMTRGSGIGKHAREALVAGREFVELIARDGGEAAPWAEDGLTGTGTREDEDMEGALVAQGCYFIRHRAEVENVDVVGTADHVVVPEFEHHLWRAPLFPEAVGKTIPHPQRAALCRIPCGAGPCDRVDGE